MQEFNPPPPGNGQNQPIYKRHVTTAGKNMVKQTWKRNSFFLDFYAWKKLKYLFCYEP